MNSCRIIDGRSIAASIRAETIDLLKNEKDGSKPTILAISVGNNPAVESYSSQKERSAISIGIDFRRKHFGPDASEGDVILALKEAADDKKIDAIMIHTPIPSVFDIGRLSDIIPAEKDVDCLNSLSRGLLYSGRPLFSPATAEAVIEILKHERIETAGKHAVILGRSLTVGRPLASLLLMHGFPGDATVTVCHSMTDDLSKFTRQADILVAAVGRPRLISGEMITKGATVIDVGINAIASGESNGQFVLTGDVDFDSASHVAGALTPVPGGVGPVTTAVLMRNVVRAWLRRKSPDNN
jgi:methylenetetrahydrofolate dehydrogenase (NADP+)/methenyltetrahydrofolate cyclohydrolase